MKKSHTIRVLLLVGAVCVAFPAFSQSSSTSNLPTSTGAGQSAQGSPEPYWTRDGRLTLGVQFGFGLENNIPNNISHINFIFAAPQIGIIAWDSPHSRFPLKRFELISQQMLGGSTHPGGSLIGTSLIMRFGFKPMGRAVPYFDAGSGPVHTTIDENAPEITGHTQFLSQGGVGLQYFVRPQRAMVFEYHYFHMSNAGLQQPNHGFNGSMFTVGFRWLRRPHPSNAGTLHSNRFHLPRLWQFL
jgi:opacity protein-like surface antigen